MLELIFYIQHALQQHKDSSYTIDIIEVPPQENWETWGGEVKPSSPFQCACLGWSTDFVHRIVDYFRGVLISVIFVASLQVTKNFTTNLSTHVIGASAWSWIATKIIITKNTFKQHHRLLTKICTPEKNLLYGIEAVQCYSSLTDWHTAGIGYIPHKQD